MYKSLETYRAAVADKKKAEAKYAAQLAEAQARLAPMDERIATFRARDVERAAELTQAHARVDAIRWYEQRAADLVAATAALPEDLRPSIAFPIGLGDALDRAQNALHNAENARGAAARDLHEGVTDLQVRRKAETQFQDALKAARSERIEADNNLASMEHYLAGTAYPRAERTVSLTKQAETHTISVDGTRHAVPHYVVATTCGASVPACFGAEQRPARCTVNHVQLCKVLDEVCHSGLLGSAPAVEGVRETRAGVYDALASEGPGPAEREHMEVVAAWLRGGCPVTGSLVRGYHPVWLTGDGLPRGRLALLSRAQLADPTKQARLAWHLAVDTLRIVYPEKKRSADGPASDAKRRA